MYGYFIALYSAGALKYESDKENFNMVKVVACDEAFSGAKSEYLRKSEKNNKAEERVAAQAIIDNIQTYFSNQ